jgi:hypothetical protein
LAQAVPFEFARLDLLLDRAQSVFDLLPFLGGYESRLCESCGVRNRTSNIVPIKSPIEGDGCAIALREVRLSLPFRIVLLPAGINHPGYGFALWKLLRHGCSSRYGYRDVLGVFQGKFSQLHCDLLDAESFEQVRCQPISECLYQICRLISHKILRFLSNNRIIHRVLDLVVQIALLVIWPERNADGQSLRSGPFFLWNSDARRNLQLLDMNPIGKRIWFVGHSPRLLRCRSEQHSFR